MHTSASFWLIIEFFVLLMIFIPTIVAFLTGAPWVPTPDARVRKVLELAKLKKGMKIYDLGCGDGRFVHLAAKEYDATAVGIELSPLVYAWGRLRNFFLKSKSTLLLRDFRAVSLKDADVIVFYLLPNILSFMRPKFERELKPGARVVSYAFEVPQWTPVYTEPRDPKRNFGRIFVYEIPTSYADPKSIKPNGTLAKK